MDLKINRPVIRTLPNTASVLQLNSRAYQSFLEEKGYIWGKLSRGKSIPDFIMQADLDSIRLFLRNYFEAEGCAVVSTRSVEIATASPLMIQQLAELLRRFGIWMRVAAKQKCATNGSRIFRTYYTGIIGGNSARRFKQEIGFLQRTQAAETGSDLRPGKQYKRRGDSCIRSRCRGCQNNKIATAPFRYA